MMMRSAPISFPISRNVLCRYAKLDDVLWFARQVIFLWDNFLQFCHQLIEHRRTFQAMLSTVFQHVQSVLSLILSSHEISSNLTIPS